MERAGHADSSKTTRTLSPADPQYGNIGAVVDAVHQGVIPDPTNGATHYWAPAAMPGGRPPPWGQQLAALNQVKIGDQDIVGGASGPGQAAADWDVNQWPSRHSRSPAAMAT